MSKVRTPLFWNVERTRRIGVGVKTASPGDVLDEHPLAAGEPLERWKTQPILPLVGQLIVQHAGSIASAQRIIQRRRA